MELRAFVAITVVILQLTVIAVNSAAVNPLEGASLKERAPRLINLGNVDGKSYFADNVTRNWAAAKTYCQSLGMELATVMSSAQIAFLKSAYNSTTFASNHWIDARDAYLERQYTWDNTGVAVTSLSSLSFGVGAPRYQTCLVYYAANSPQINIYKCETTWKTLCQT
ncbi:unnamed protein product [Orchesella dallaii]|uniref:C-type lectin domain-containing protein n=1 Tax=Orchesella dallaii TaxID=48710 RepID=A0ABP1S544_9HEXA